MRLAFDRMMFKTKNNNLLNVETKIGTTGLEGIWTQLSARRSTNALVNYVINLQLASSSGSVCWGPAAQNVAGWKTGERGYVHPFFRAQFFEISASIVGPVWYFAEI